MAGDHDTRQRIAGILQALQNIQTAHSRKIGVDQQAFISSGAVGIDKRFAILIVLHDTAVVLQHAANGVAYVGVVIDDIHDGRPRCSRFNRSRDFYFGECRLRSKALDRREQLPQTGRLVEVLTILRGDITQRLCRDITSQNDHRHGSTKSRAKLRCYAEPIHAIRQIEVGNDQSWHKSVSLDQIQGLNPVIGRNNLMTFPADTDLEEIAYFRVILNNQNSPGRPRVMKFGSNAVQATFGASRPPAGRLPDFNREN